MHKDQYKTLFRFFFWSGLILLVVLRYFDLNPVQMEEEVVESIATKAPKREAGETLVVVDQSVIRQKAASADFDTVDWSYAWSNTIEQEIGPHTVVDASTLRSVELARYRYVILTSSASEKGDDIDLVTQLERYVKRGGVLVLERPRGRLRKSFSADGGGGERRPENVSRVKYLKDPYLTQLKELPLYTTYVGSSAPAVGAQVYLSMDGAPVVYSVPMERGHAITVEFNYGLQMMAMQQGLPEADFSVRNRYPGQLQPPLEASDLVMSDRLLNNEVPYADLLEKYLVHIVFNDARPVISLWPFKHSKEGALLMTHDEEMMGNKSSWMAEWEKEKGYRSTYFVIPSEYFTLKGSRALRKAGADVQLHWNRPQDGQGIFDPVGVWKIQPFARPHSLKEQQEALNELLPRGKKILANRNHYLLWSDTYTGVFRQLSAAGINMDSTYGPDLGCRGYLFGTGQPFWALDANGIPLPVMEIPFLTAEDLGDVDSAYLYKLFRESQRGYHQSINLLFHPNAYVWRPSVELFDLWLSAYDLAEDTQHWITTMRFLYGFWKERRSASLSSRTRILPAETPEDLDAPDPNKDKKKDEPEDILSNKNDAEPKPEPLQIIAEVNVSASGHSLSVPVRIGEQSLSKVIRGDSNGSPLLDDRTITPSVTHVIGERLALIPLNKGFNTITITYR